jgi:phosphoribosyl-dephospho-CoA transferase
MMFARHDLAWLSREGWEAVRRAALPAHVPAIDQWCQDGWPATVRRQDVGILPDQVCLGMTPPCEQQGEPRVRISLTCLQGHIERISRPLDLHAVEAAVPGRWKADWRSLQAAVAAERLDIRVFGSLAMQAVTGRPYLTGRSDIDLLFSPASHEQLDAGMDLLTHCVKILPLDGEVVFPSGRAVAWKEWHQASLCGGPGRVLAKRLDAVGLHTVDELRAEIGEASCMR